MNYIKSLLITLSVLLIITISFGTLSYFGIINEKVLKTIQMISLLFSISIESYYLGKNKDKKGYIEGIINGSITLVIFLIINILFKRKVDILKFILYIMIFFVSTLSSILGINKKMKD